MYSRFELMLGHALRVLVICLLAFSLGVGTTLIQLLGWATMLPTHWVQTGSVNQAVENTFDGEHACPMCKIAAAKREADQSSNPEAPSNRVEKWKSVMLYSLLDEVPRLFAPKQDAFDVPENSATKYSYFHAVDIPPPRYS